MSHMPLQTIKERLAVLGVKCHILPGAQGRSARMWGAAGYPRGCQAFCSHHTVSSGQTPANDINYILRGKGEGYVIANAYTDIFGAVHLIASGPTYTEGSGGPRGLIPENGGNSVCFSNEIASWGAENSIYPVVQQLAAVSLAAVAAQVGAEQYDWSEGPWHPWRNFAHFEWAPGRKVDPRGVSRWSEAGGMWDMDSFRSTVEGILTEQEVDVFHIITNAKDCAFRMKGYKDVVAIVGGVPQPVTWDNAAKVFGIDDDTLRGISANPVPLHEETVRWLKVHGIAMTPSDGGR